jgi:hypothetical protein
VVTVTGQFRSVCAAIVLVAVGACGGGSENRADAPAAAPAASPPAASAATPAAKSADHSCPLTVEQVAAVTGVPMTLTGGCTFFPANGRDVPHVFYVLQVPMVCASIKPSDLGFTETVAGLAAREAYVRDQLDGAHVLVCPNGNTRAFDIVVDIKNDKAKNREVAIALAKQVLAAR